MDSQKTSYPRCINFLSFRRTRARCNDRKFSNEAGKRACETPDKEFLRFHQYIYLEKFVYIMGDGVVKSPIYEFIMDYQSKCFMK